MVRHIKIAIAAISQNLGPFIVPAKIGSLDSDFSGDIHIIIIVAPDQY